MKVDKLMIGDLVKQKHSGLLLKVCAIDPPYARAENECGQFHEDTIEPIAITTEMLEENFSSCQNWWFIGRKDVFFRLYERDEKNGHVIVIKSRQVQELRMSVRYVHELQHAICPALKMRLKYVQTKNQRTLQAARHHAS